MTPLNADNVQAVDIERIWAMPSARAGRQSPSHSSVSRLYRATIAIAVRAIEGETYWLILGGLVAWNVGVVLMLVRS